VVVAVELELEAQKVLVVLVAAVTVLKQAILMVGTQRSILAGVGVVVQKPLELQMAATAAQALSLSKYLTT
jgi:hypothetical protein